MLALALGSLGAAKLGGISGACTGTVTGNGGRPGVAAPASGPPKSGAPAAVVATLRRGRFRPGVPGAGGTS
eukprot:12722552-Prorocentrum_lima.AAC.1